MGRIKLGVWNIEPIRRAFPTASDHYPVSVTVTLDSFRDGESPESS